MTEPSSHWRCRICDTFDGPTSDHNCDVCAQEGITERVEEFVPADQLRGAVEALERILALTMDSQRADRSIVTDVNVAAYAALHMPGGSK